MSESLTFSELALFISGSAAAIRSITRLQPVGGEGDKVFPATYAGGVYSTEQRMVGETAVTCVLIDSVQSQANRAEEALKTAIDRQRINLPLITVDFGDANKSFRTDIQNLTSLDVPHRLADAILRDSLIPDGTRFSKSSYAQSWRRANLWNATPVYELCPTALLFGMWGSPDKPGAMGAKFERAYLSEIVAVDVIGRKSAGMRRGFRIDPLNASKTVLVKPNQDGSFQVGSGGKLRPSEINHGNIPFDSDNSGIRFRYAEQTTVVSFGALRKLRFPVDGKDDIKRNDAGRTVLAALGLCAGTLATEANTSLRSRCHLWPIKERSWEVLEKPGQEPIRYSVNGSQAVALLKEAVTAAEAAGLRWNLDNITLRPSPELIELVRRSQEEAAKDKGEGEAK